MHRAIYGWYVRKPWIDVPWNGYRNRAIHGCMWLIRLGLTIIPISCIMFNCCPLQLPKECTVKLFKLVLVVFMMMFSMAAFADAPKTLLTPEQKNAIVADLLARGESAAAKRVLNDTYVPDAEKKAADNRRVIDHAKEWSDLGTKLGTALVATAKEVGMAVTDFANTPLGKVTTAVVVYKVIGNDLISTGLAVLFFMTGMLFLPFMYRFIVYKEIEYEYIPMLWGMWQRRRVKSLKMRKAESFSDFSPAFFGYVGLIFYFGSVVFFTWAMLPK
jgi:hypothetical protein